MSYAITSDDVLAAADRIAPHAVRTPVIHSSKLSERIGASIYCKSENLQRTGAFKFRGATNAVSALDPTEASKGVITYSSGNHGQAISRAAGIFGYPATIVMPSDAPPIKVAATESWGATIVTYDRYLESREDTAAQVQAETGGVLIPPYDHADVMAGQGTVALELLEQVSDLDVLVIPVGGGGLLAGCATIASHMHPSVSIIGVEPEAGDDHVRSRAAGQIVAFEDVPRTIADGQQVKAPGALTWPINNALVDDFVTVTDEEIIGAMRTLFLHHKLVVEPSGASALAAVMHRSIVPEGSRAGVVLSGGNVGLDTFAELVTGPEVDPGSSAR